MIIFNVSNYCDTKETKKDAKTVSICLDECQDITLINQSF